VAEDGEESAEDAGHNNAEYGVSQLSLAEENTLLANDLPDSEPPNLPEISGPGLLSP
jgi:hypothetical protein